MTAGPIPLFPQGANPEVQYEYKSWPAWRFRKDGETGQIFNGPEEVPDGWYSRDELDAMDVDELAEPEPEPEPDTDADEDTGTDEDLRLSPEFRTEDAPRQLTADQRKEQIAKLIDENSQADLVAMLDLKNESAENEIEFGRAWPKKKLAETIVDNGGPLEG